MKWELFTKLADELKDSEAIHLFNRGEPFTHPRIYDMIDYVQANGTKVILASNALLIDEKKLYNHFKNGLLVISCHAGNKETYKKITGKDGYYKVIKKAKYLEDNAPERVDFRIKFVKQDLNKGQEDELIKLFKRVDVVEDSNQENPLGYVDCTQPDVCPTWDFKGNKKVCCRDEFSEHDYQTYYEQAKLRQLNICKRCAIH